MELKDAFAFLNQATPDEVRQVLNLAFKLNRNNKKSGNSPIKARVSTNVATEPLDGVTVDPNHTPDYQLAALLWKIVHENFSFIKEPKLEKWASDIEKIHRIDGFDYKLIQGVIVWASNDSFWRQNVRSGESLRRHFEKILVKVKSDREKGGQVHSV